MGSDWAAEFERELARYADGEARVGGIEDADERQRQLTRMGNAATGAGLALVMDGRPGDAAEWFARAAERYRESFPHAPPGSWGRPIGAIKARVLACDAAAAAEEAQWALAAGAAESESPIGRYAGCLALLVLGRDDEAALLAGSMRGRDDFPSAVADTLHALATRDRDGYELAVGTVLTSFETRDEYLEDIPVADTVIVLQTLARDRGLEVTLRSSLLPPASR